jgi:Protein of unknown function (DUF2608)
MSDEVSKLFKIKKLIFFIVCLPVYISAVIVETDRIQDIMKYADKNTLILLNIDIAVIESSIFLGSGPWYDFLKIKTEELHDKHPEIDSNFYYKMMLYITQKVPVVGVEGETSSFIKKLQENHYPVLAFTGRGKDKLHSLPIPNYDKQTQTELQQADIDFSQSDIPEKFQELLEPYNLVNGIIFGGDAKKGPFLKELLVQSYIPEKIVFASKLDHLISVKKSMKELGVDFVGIHYNHISQNAHKFDPLVALIQLEAIMENNQVLSNEEAMRLKPQYENLAIEEFTELLVLQFLEFLHSHPDFPHIE